MSPADAPLRFLAHSVFAIVIALICAVPRPTLAQQPSVKDNEIRGTVTSAKARKPASG